MAKTVAYIQEHGYDTRDSLEDSFTEIKNQASSSRKELKSIEDKLKTTNEQIHYTGQYLANKSVYQQFFRLKNKGRFRKELDMVCSNVDMILGQPHSRQTEKQKSADIS